MERNDGVREAAFKLAARPVNFSNLYFVYETVRGLMSPKKDRSDWQHLVSLGWISEEDSTRFKKTAHHYRHGHPREPIKHSSPMSLDEAMHLIRGLYQQMIDALQPK